MVWGFPWIGAFGLLIYLAGLMGISPDIYNAYTIESTSTLRRIWHLDVPLVRGQTRLLVILTFISSVQDFQTVLIMTRGGRVWPRTCLHCACTIRPLYTATSAMGRPLD